MKIYDAVYTAAVFLQLGELTDGMKKTDFDRSDPSESLGEEDAKELDLLVRCCKLVLHELSVSDFPIKAQTTVEAKDGRIGFADLPENLLDIISVQKGGKSVPFTEFFDCVTVPFSGECKVTYTVAHPDITLDGDAYYVGNKPSAGLVAYGIAREYCLISGMSDDAATWDNRFIARIEEEGRSRKERRVRARVWR